MIRIIFLCACLLFAVMAQCQQRRDERMKPITAQELTQRIQITPLESRAHRILIARAYESHLLKTAYEQYTRLWRKKPEDAYTNFWRGSVSRSYWRYATSPQVKKLSLDSPLANELFKSMQDCLLKAVQKAPNSALTNSEYGYVLVIYGHEIKGWSQYAGTKYLDKAAKIAPRDADVLTLSGDAYCTPYRETYNPVIGIRDLMLAAQIEPDYAIPHWVLARTYILTKAYKKAQEEIARFLMLTPPEAKKYVASMQEQITEATHK